MTRGKNGALLATELIVPVIIMTDAVISLIQPGAKVTRSKQAGLKSKWYLEGLVYGGLPP